LLDSGFEHCILESNHTGDVYHKYIVVQQEVGNPSVSAQRNIAIPADATGGDDGKGNPTLDPIVERNFQEAFQLRRLIPLDDF